MQMRSVEIVKASIMWVAVAFLLFLFLSPKLLALNLFRLDLSFVLVPSLSMVVILFCSNVASIVIEHSSQREIATKQLRILALSVFIFLLFKNAVDTALAILPQGYVLVFYVSFSFAGGLLGLSLGSLLRLLEDDSDPRISSVSKWISEGLTRNFVLGFFLTTYLGFIRRPLIELNPYVTIAEWVITALAVAVLYVNVKMVFEELYLDLRNTEWRKHIQEVERETGDDFKHLTFIQEQFVNQGIKEPLLVYLTLHLSNFGKTEQQIVRTAAPLLNYRDKKPWIFALPSVKEIFRKKNKEARKEILKDLTTEIEGQMNSL